MTSDDFNAWQARLAPSRRQFCAALGISRRTGDAYALGRAPVPPVVALAISALSKGLACAEAPEAEADF